MQELVEAVKALKQPPQTEYCLLGIDHWLLCLDKAQWAAWVQAGGAIAALAITLFLWQHAMRSAQRRSRMSLLIFLSTASAATGLMRRAADKASFVRALSMLRESLAIAQAIDVVNLSGTNQQVALLAVRAACKDAISRADEIKGALYPTLEDRTLFTEVIRVLAEQTKRIGLKTLTVQKLLEEVEELDRLEKAGGATRQSNHPQ